MARISPPDLRLMKRRGQRFAMVTAYDYALAKLADRAGARVILVGDSLGMVALGFQTTHKVKLSDVLRASAAVARGAPNSLVVADMPFMSYQVSPNRAVKKAGKLLKEGDAQAVKIEGGKGYAATVKRLVDAGIPVMGHVGLTPQSFYNFGGYKVQGKDAQTAQAIYDDAVSLQEAGAFAVVLELVPDDLAGQITDALSIPTIGIGAGKQVDAQVQVITDLLGLEPDFKPKHARPYADLATAVTDAVSAFAADVAEGRF